MGALMAAADVTITVHIIADGRAVSKKDMKELREHANRLGIAMKVLTDAEADLLFGEKTSRPPLGILHAG